jgi:signal transduction histidine kinase
MRISGFIVLIVVLSYQSTIHAQELAEQLLTNREFDNDSLRVDYVLGYADSIFVLDTERARQLYQSAAKMASVSALPYSEAYANYQLSSIYWKRGEYANCLNLDHATLRIYEELKDSVYMAETLLGIGVVYSDMGMNELAAEKYLQAHKIYKALGDKEGECYIYMNLGVAFSEVGNGTKAVSYYQKALHLADSLGLEEEMGDILMNLGSEYENGESKLALDYYLLAKPIKEQHSQSYNLDLLCLNIGWCYVELDVPDSALHYINRGLSLGRKYNQADYAYGQYVFAQHFWRLKDFELAKVHLDSCKTLSIAMGYMPQMVDALQLEYEIYAARGDYRQAFESQSQYLTLRDSLDQYNRASQIDKMMLAQETENRDREISLLMSQMESDELSSSIKNILLFGSVILMLILLAFGILQFRYRAKFKTQNLELQHLNERMEEEKLLAEAATKAKTDFLSTMSHELRTPINAVIGVTNLMMFNRHYPEQQENLEILQYSSQNLISLINDILDFNKLEAGKVELELQPSNVSEVLQTLVLTHNVHATQKNIELSCELDPEIPASLFIDNTRLSQMINNLLSNALKFTPAAGRIVLRAKLIDQSGKENRLFIEVEDNGIGIPADKVNRVFDTFSQAETFITRKYGGSGLGLTISQRILKLMDSELKVESKEGQGSRFYFELPLTTAVQDSDEFYFDQDALLDSIVGKRILVVDDNKLNLIVTKKFLEMNGAIAEVFQSGEEAIEVLKTQNFDLVLMDLQMPEMDGFQTTAVIKSKYPTLRVVALTAGSKEEMLSRQESALFDGYLRKPVNPDDLLDLIQKLCN